MQHDYEIQANGKFKNNKIANPAYKLIKGWDHHKMGYELSMIRKTCYSCGKPIKIGRHCLACKEKRRIYKIKRRKESIKLGICRRCFNKLSSDLIERGAKYHQKNARGICIK